MIRAIAIVIEVLILAAMMYVMLAGVRLIMFDLGLGRKYDRFIVTALLLVGAVSVVFFIAHLTSFYPGA